MTPARRHRYINNDFKPQPGLPRTRMTPRIWWAFLLLLSLTAYYGVRLHPKPNQQPHHLNISYPSADERGYELELPEPVPRQDNSLDWQPIRAAAMPLQSKATETKVSLPGANKSTGMDSPQTSTIWQAITMNAGDSLWWRLHKMGISSSTLHHLFTAPHAQQLKTLHPGERLQAGFDDEHRLVALRYDKTPLESWIYTRSTLQPDEFHGEHVLREALTTTEYAEVHIQNSLFIDGIQAGLSDKLLMNLAQIFAWDIDFALDLRKGDHFKLTYQKLEVDGDTFDNGIILAAEFTAGGKQHRAIRYTLPDGQSQYFTPDGHPLKKAFVRTPVKFTRISSKFSAERHHPVLHTIRAHKGVDYAAPTGTPVKATGDGKIEFLGENGGYGNMIVLTHGQRYTTAYAHLHTFAKGLKRGSKVKQNQIIGYVGQSGLATGPHLHYEFRINGVHRDPLTVSLPSAEPLSHDLMADFRTHANLQLAQLDNHHHIYLAQSDL